ncbi:MAG: flagellar protein FliT [Lachnospiraceae bacterium]|nr:flagellar protein FliT [Lachnospiraceae bacterium]
MIENYLDILADSLQKKLIVLDKIEDENNQQAKMLKSDSFPYDEFDAAIDRKGGLIEELTALDDGFDSLYQRIREQLQDNRDRYKGQIAELQELVKKVTDKSIAVQAQEARNKQLVEAAFAKEKNSVKFSKMNSKAAYGYYKSMSKGNVVIPQFMDKKK